MMRLMMPFALVIHFTLIGIAFTFAQQGNVAMTGFWLFMAVRLWSMSGALWRAWVEANENIAKEQRDAQT